MPRFGRDLQGEADFEDFTETETGSQAGSQAPTEMTDGTQLEEDER